MIKLTFTDRMTIANIIRNHAHMLEAEKNPLLLPRITRRHRQATRVLRGGDFMVEASPCSCINCGDTAHNVTEASQP